MCIAKWNASVPSSQGQPSNNGGGPGLVGSLAGQVTVYAFAGHSADFPDRCVVAIGVPDRGGLAFILNEQSNGSFYVSGGSASMQVSQLPEAEKQWNARGNSDGTLSQSDSSTTATSTTAPPQVANGPTETTPPTSGGGGSDPPGNTTNTQTYSGKAYSARYPSDSTVVEQERSHGNYSDTKFVSRDHSLAVVIDRSPGVTADPGSSARGVERGVKALPGYRRFLFNATVLNGSPAFVWSFVEEGHSLPFRTVYYFNLGGDGYAALVKAADGPITDPLAREVAQSVKATSSG